MTTKRTAFASADVALWAVVLALGVFAASGWWVRFSDQSIALASIMVAVSIAAAAVAPTLLPVFERGDAGGKALAVAALVVFGGVDAIGGHNAFVTYEARAAEAGIASRQAQARLDVDAAQARFDALPSVIEACQGVGPQGCSVRAAALQQARSDAAAAVDAAQARYDAAAVVEPILDHTAVLIGMLAIQGAIAVGVLAISRTRRTMAQQIAADRAAKAKAKAKAKRPVKQPLRLVAVNDR